MRGKLTKAQEKMLTGEFFIDGWNNRDFLEEANQLVVLGLLTRREYGDDQYTAFEYKPAGLQTITEKE